MAATGYTPISLYYSTTASTAPSPSNLVAGELALNTLDEKLYFKNSAGTVKLLASNAGSAGSVTSVAQSFTGGIISVTGSPITSSGTLALTVAGTSGGIPYFSSGTAWATSAALTQYGVVYGGGAGAAPVATAAGTTGQVLTATTGGAPTWATPASGGTVTSVSWTGGIVSVATATTTPAFTIAGTSGGIPYFSSGTTWATSAALAANAIVLGGGAGAAPATTTTGTGVVTALGVNTGTAGAVVVNGGVLGTPSSGTATNLTGLPLSTGVTGTLPVANGGTGVTTSTGSGNNVLSTSPTLVTPVLGTPTSGNLSNCTTDGTNGVGYINVPQNAQTGSYTLVAADAGKHIYHAAAAAAATYTIPANGSVAYVIGTAVTFINMSTNNVTIAITTDTLYLGGTGTTGSRTLAQYGVATAVKMTSTTWVITGSGLT